MRGVRLIALAGLLTVVLLGVGLIVAGQRSPAGEVMTIEITARQFEYQPEVIRVKQGQRVRLVMRTLDVSHGLGIREYNINLKATPGDPGVIEFTADRAGRFAMFCTVYCGVGHAEHDGVLIVEGD